MTIEQLREKLRAAEEKVEKCRKTIERHELQMAKKGKQLRDMSIDPEATDKYTLIQNGSQMNREAYWLLSDYDDKKDDIKNAIQKLQDAERISAGWKEKLDLEINKEKIINDNAPQVIKDFLDDWKKKTFAWYVKRYDDFLDFRKRLRAEERAARLEALATLPEYEKERERCAKLFEGKEPDDSYLLNLWPRKPLEAFLTERNLDYKNIQKQLANFGDQVIFKMLDYRDPEKRLTFLEAVLEEDKKQQLLNLVTSITNITGPITDAKHLYLSAGEINGIIFGENGVAKTQSFSAGGWNIQRFHYRTRIDDVTEKYKDDPAFIKSNERICTYRFSDVEAGDDMIAEDYGLAVVDICKDGLTVKGQYRDILAFADQYLGQSLESDRLQSAENVKPGLDDVIKSCLIRSKAEVARSPEKADIDLGR